MLRLILVFSLLSFNVFADELEHGDEARFNYQETSIYKILSATLDLQNEGPDFSSGFLKIRAMVEGNICQNYPRSLGTFDVKKDDRTFVYLLVRHLKTSDQDQCAQYSKEVRIQANLKIQLERGETKLLDLDGNMITLKEVNGTWIATISNTQEK